MRNIFKKWYYLLILERKWYTPDNQLIYSAKLYFNLKIKLLNDSNFIFIIFLIFLAFLKINWKIFQN